MIRTAISTTIYPYLLYCRPLGLQKHTKALQKGEGEQSKKPLSLLYTEYKINETSNKATGVYHFPTTSFYYARQHIRGFDFRVEVTTESGSYVKLS